VSQTVFARLQSGCSAIQGLQIAKPATNDFSQEGEGNGDITYYDAGGEDGNEGGDMDYDMEEFVEGVEQETAEILKLPPALKDESYSTSLGKSILDITLTVMA